MRIDRSRLIGFGRRTRRGSEDVSRLRVCLVSSAVLTNHSAHPPECTTALHRPRRRVTCPLDPHTSRPVGHAYDTGRIDRPGPSTSEQRRCSASGLREPNPVGNTQPPDGAYCVWRLVLASDSTVNPSRARRRLSPSEKYDLYVACSPGSTRSGRTGGWPRPSPRRCLGRRLTAPRRNLHRHIRATSSRPSGSPTVHRMVRPPAHG
jgi:hypothetical protein